MNTEQLITESLNKNISDLERELYDQLGEYAKAEIHNSVEISSEGLDSTFSNQQLFDDQRELFSRALNDFIKKAVETNKEILHRRVCVDFDYCNRKAKYDDKNQNIVLYSLIADVICGILTTFPVVSAATLTTLLIKTKVFDKLCACDQ